ncbi:MarC family protein [Thalassolituus sp. LLYu03]|uniref:MarC family protein n=1 Tax=Thalassolituus sp. LLYu03 TaxID=3421656 RepID=UPI003D26C1E4
MSESFALAFATLFATVSPIDVSAIFAAITTKSGQEARRHMALRGVMIASLVLFTFAFIGDWLLHALGISLAALRTAGGIMLLMMGLDMVFARMSSANAPTVQEQAEALGREDVSVFPLALPLIAGPGSMGAVILLMAQSKADLMAQAGVIAALVLVMALTLGSLLASTQLNRLLGVTGMAVITRVMGVLLCALAVQFVFDGIMASGLIEAFARAMLKE